ncbi:MAG TPA: menaquinone biosynthesis protein [Candidatus Binatia bacterium]|nr:menaquinone biosynthesis protein [Candidatus Binatia bacterium]
MPGLRIAAISFLNTAPLMWDFEHGDAARNFAINYTSPSTCAAELAANQSDIGIIPAFAWAQIPGLLILPNIAIASKDRVRSILLVSKKPLEDVRTVATDTSSRTSVALLQVLFARFFGGPRRLEAHLPQLRDMLRDHDAALLIGDAALEVPANAGYHLYDLAHLWHQATSQPFVFAFWAVRLDALNRTPAGLNLTRVFQQSRDHGLQSDSLETIANEWSPKLGLSREDIRSYLTTNINYYLDRENHAGLKLFLQYSQEIGLIPAVPELRFLGPVAFAGVRR